MWYPLRFKPVYKDYLWGGDRILRAFGRDEPPGVYAESWEVSTRPEGASIVANGPFAGRGLADLIGEHGAALLGTRIGNGPFPLLIKLIDARQTLSVQVHPSDESAARYGGEAKTEMWYTLDADPGACVYAGLEAGTGRADFEAAVKTGRFEALLHTIPVRPGDAVFMPGGRVHAIGAGCLLLEVQQNSNTTYRVYDWGRVDKDGRPRATHIDRAMQVIAWNDTGDARVVPAPEQPVEGGCASRILRCAYFMLERLALEGPWTADTGGESFQAIFVEDGAVAIAGPSGADILRRGTTFFLPAALRHAVVRPAGGPAALLRVTVPGPA